MTWTDIAVLTILTLLISNGAFQGILRTLVGPACFIVGTLVGLGIFWITHNFVAGAFTATVGSFFLTWGVNSLIRLRSGEQPPEISILSRIGGAAFNLFWGSAILAPLLLLFTLLPLKDPRLEATHRDMNASKTYHLLEQMIVGKKELRPIPANCPASACGISDADKKALASDQTVKDLLGDERIQDLLNDPELKDAMEKKDFGRLFANPSFMKLWQDPALLAKILKAYPKIQERMTQPVPAGH